MEGDILLFFSVAEKEAFLIKHGYRIERKVVDREEHVHGSRFVPFLTLEVRAIKGEIKEDLHKAFERELKAKILGL